MLQRRKKPRKALLRGAFLSGLCLFWFVALIQSNNQVLASSNSGARVLDMHFASMYQNQLLDSSGYGNHGTNHGATLIEEVGFPSGKALELDEYNDYVDLHKPNLLRLDNTDFTIAVWVYLHGFPDSWGSTIFFEAGGGKGSDWYQCVALSIRTSRKIKLWFYGDQYETSTLVPLGEWTHITVTYDKSSKLGKFYVNGDYKESHTFSHGPAFYEWAGVRLGQRYLEGWGFEVRDFYGKMDEVHVYRQILSRSEVGYIYDQETSGSPWFYGVSMAPPYTEYDSIEMPTSGMDWTSPPVGSFFGFWVGATTKDNWGNDWVFAQCGYLYNGLNQGIKMPNGPTTIPAHSWTLFWTYAYVPYNLYYGDVVLPPSGWLHTHPIYFSIAVYPSSNCLVFMFTNPSQSPPILEYRSVVLYEPFAGNVGGLAESGERSGFGDIYVDRVAVWAQIPEQRSCGPGNTYDVNTAPNDSDVLSRVLIDVEADNIIQVGFYNGTHYLPWEQLWNSTYYVGPEYFPPECP